MHAGCDKRGAAASDAVDKRSDRIASGLHLILIDKDQDQDQEIRRSSLIRIRIGRSGSRDLDIKRFGDQEIMRIGDF